jgi:hypothetical protein
VTYQVARKAISKCSKIDESKSWSDKAAALVSYARQARDHTLRIMAGRIQARTVRRCGELLKEVTAGRALGTSMESLVTAAARSCSGAAFARCVNRTPEPSLQANSRLRGTDYHRPDGQNTWLRDRQLVESIALGTPVAIARLDLRRFKSDWTRSAKLKYKICHGARFPKRC